MGKEWIRQVFGTEKPIIAMCHLDAMPGDPHYNKAKGIDYIIERARTNLHALQDGGVDAVMFSNEFSLPYMTKTDAITSMAMARIIGELKSEIGIPFGVNVLWDDIATVELAVATGASFVREIFSGVYASDFGLWNTDYGRTARRRAEIGGEDVRLMFNIFPEASAYLGQRTLADIAKTTMFNCQSDMICVSGSTAGIETRQDLLEQVCAAIPEVPVFANTGCTKENIAKKLAICDGAVVATTFKKDGLFPEMVDQQRVSEFMDVVHSLRK